MCQMNFYFRTEAGPGRCTQPFLRSRVKRAPCLGVMRATDSAAMGLRLSVKLSHCSGVSGFTATAADFNKHHSPFFSPQIFENGSFAIHSRPCERKAAETSAPRSVKLRTQFRFEEGYLQHIVSHFAEQKHRGSRDRERTLPLEGN